MDTVFDYEQELLRGYRNRHCERPKALLQDSKKVPYVILAKSGNPENYSHPEFISGYFSRDAETSSA
ncbi:hypothetical protein [Rickettsia endosymbiont of Orchestes rusci]|uniref:hypothetical protein n=1 Tax=Rickettsia endosymbiont of Orchestes rusci TaxID=3066250 RepID=UPI00313D7DC1